jgi:hypothetical protein
VSHLFKCCARCTDRRHSKANLGVKKKVFVHE